MAVAASLAGSTLQMAPAAVAGAKSALEGGGGVGPDDAAAAAAAGAAAVEGAVASSGEGSGIGGDGGGWGLGQVGEVECEAPTSLTPYFNLFLAVWATVSERS